MRLVKNNAIMKGYRLTEPLLIPGPDGYPVEVARPGDLTLWQEVEEGYTFKGLLTEKERLEKHTVV